MNEPKIGSTELSLLSWCLKGGWALLLLRDCSLELVVETSVLRTSGASKFPGETHEYKNS